MILRMGNFLNTNSYKGKTAGFKVSSLLELQSLKATRGSVTSLHFIVEQFENNHRNDQAAAFSFLSELKAIGIVLNHGSYSNLQSDFNLIDRNVNDFMRQIESSASSCTDIKDQYSTIFSGFVTKVLKLAEEFSTLNKAKADIVIAYAEDDLTFNLDSFLKIFYEFSNNITKAREVYSYKIV